MNYREKEIQKLEAAKYTRHHLISKCQQDLFDVFNPINVRRIRRDTHKAIHTLFTDENWPIHEPQLQMAKFFELISPIVWDYALKYMDKLVNMPKEEFYKKELIRWKHK